MNISDSVSVNSANTESPEYLAHRLLIEFGKTRTNYNSLVPRIVEVMRIFRDYGPLKCPLPVVSNLDELLNDESLIRIEHRYPNSIDAGFLVLCTERRALRSGGGGKYYFIDTSGRLIGCHKSDLPHYAEKGVLQGPVLLKNLIFVFIMKGVYGLDPRCKSSNPQRLLEFYENLLKKGNLSDIQSLVRVWSMEIHPEVPYDSGFPHCTLLWVKRMNIESHIAKWKHSQWQTNQSRHSDAYNFYLRQSVSNPQGQMYICQNSKSNEILTCNNYKNSVNGRSKYQKVKRTGSFRSKISSLPPCIQWSTDLNVNGVNITCTGIHNDSTINLPLSLDSEKQNYFLNIQNNLWDISSIEALYFNFLEFSSMLEKTDIIDWSILLTDRLIFPMLSTASNLINITFFNITLADETANNDKALRYDVLRTINNIKDENKMKQALKILLACLIEQYKSEEIRQDKNINFSLHNIVDLPNLMSSNPKCATTLYSQNHIECNELYSHDTTEPSSRSTNTDTLSSTDDFSNEDNDLLGIKTANNHLDSFLMKEPPSTLSQVFKSFIYP